MLYKKYFEGNKSAWDFEWVITIKIDLFVFDCEIKNKSNPKNNIKPKVDKE